jgi:hypothetical protein
VPVPSETPSRPGSITAAQVLVCLQVVFLCCCGVAPVMMWVPAFLAVALAAVPAIVQAEALAWAVLLLVLAGGVASAVATARRLGDGDRRGRSWVSAGFAVLLALGFAAAASTAGEASMPSAALATAAPSVLCQAIAWVCVQSASAERWFRECEPYRVDPEL